VLAQYLYRYARTPVRFRLLEDETQQAMRNLTSLHQVAHGIPARGPALLRALAGSPQTLQQMLALHASQQTPDALEALLAQLRGGGYGQGQGDPDVQAYYFALAQLLPQLRAMSQGDSRAVGTYRDRSFASHTADTFDAMQASGANRELPGILAGLSQVPGVIQPHAMDQLNQQAQASMGGDLPSLLALYHSLVSQRHARPPMASTGIDQMLDRGAGLTSTAARHLKASLSRKLSQKAPSGG
jgi:hypothetical protein